MITAYRPCKTSPDQGPNTVNAQQWNILEKIDQEDENLREKMIIDLGTHINQIINKQHEVILFIDANEPHIYGSGIDKLIKRTTMIDPILFYAMAVITNQIHTSAVQTGLILFCALD